MENSIAIHQKLNIVTIKSSNSIPRYTAKGNTIIYLYKNLYMNVHNSQNQNNSYAYQLVDELQKVVYSYNEMFSHKK